MRATILPMNELQFKPAFWGLESNLKGAVNRLESAWEGERIFSDFHETEKAFVYMLDMPGVSKKDLDLQIEGDMVHISGKRTFPFGDKDKGIEISRSIKVPKDVNKDEVQAHCNDGVLYLAFPKEEKAQPKKIKINDSDKKAWNKLLGNEASH